ncbi:hypothetical protein E4U41_005105 [Claviceps citrina]|nr:hypothetical protein E4U41_005105 [Claviceps citrina]
MATMATMGQFVRGPIHLDLHKFYKTFTFGGPFWSDNYLLHRWDSCTRASSTKATPYVASMRDNFTIGHHLSRQDPAYKDITYEVILYPTTGSCMNRAFHTDETPSSPFVPLSLEARHRYIRQLVRGMADLHRIGAVHADLHPGNVAFAESDATHMKKLLDTPCVQHDLIREDGSPTPAHLPRRVCKTDDLLFDPGSIKIIDFGYSFRPVHGEVYSADVFPVDIDRPPELFEGEKTTSQPFKADSWYLGQMDYTQYILSLLEFQPEKRRSVIDLCQDKVFMEYVI